MHKTVFPFGNQPETAKHVGIPVSDKEFSLSIRPVYGIFLLNYYITFKPELREIK
jgi:hypothetical protein